MSLPSSPLAPSPSGHTTPQPLRTPGLPAHSPLPLDAQAPVMQARKSLPGSMGVPPPAATKTPRVAHPLAQSQPVAAPRTQQAGYDPDRPDSDSENSDDELVVVPPKGQGLAQPAQKMPKGANGAGAGPGAGQAKGQKTPRKVPPPGGRKAVARGASQSSFRREQELTNTVQLSPTLAQRATTMRRLDPTRTEPPFPSRSHTVYTARSCIRFHSFLHSRILAFVLSPSAGTSNERTRTIDAKCEYERSEQQRWSQEKRTQHELWI